MTAVNSQENSVIALEVKKIALRPSVLRIARVRVPLVSASRATRDMSRGPCAILSPSIAAWVPALACTRPTSPTTRTSSLVFSTLTDSRAARTRTAGSASDAPRTAPLSFDQSTASRAERANQSDICTVMRPVRRAPFTTHNPRAPTRGAPPRRYIGAARHHQANAGEPKDHLVDLLAAGEPRALAHRITDIAEYEQVTDRGPRQSDEIVGLSGDEPMPELACRAACRGDAGTSRLDPAGQIRVDGHVPIGREIEEALGEVDVIGGERRFDLARCYAAVEGTGELPIRQQGRVILRKKQGLRLDGARHNGQSSNRTGTAKAKRQRDPRPGHPSSAPQPSCPRPTT